MAPAPPLIEIGVRDWEHPGWQGVFYPEDLPAEWRLGYYANEWRAVLVPYQRWAAGEEPAVDRRLRQWCSEVDEQFTLLLEPAPPGAGAPYLPATGRIDPSGRLMMAPSAGWRVDGTPSGVTVGMIDINQTTPRQLRQAVESFRDQLTTPRGWLIATAVDDATPSLEAVRQLRWVKELLGY